MVIVLAADNDLNGTKFFRQELWHSIVPANDE